MMFFIHYKLAANSILLETKDTRSRKLLLLCLSIFNILLAV